MSDDDEDCTHDGVECEQPCFCTCTVCINTYYDLEVEEEDDQASTT